MALKATNIHRARRLAAPRLGAVESRAERETDRDVQLAFAVRPVAELHARHHPRVEQLQGAGEQRSGIHTTKLPERPHRQSAFTHTKQRKASNTHLLFLFRNINLGDYLNKLLKQPKKTHNPMHTDKNCILKKPRR